MAGVCGLAAVRAAGFIRLIWVTLCTRILWPLYPLWRVSTFDYYDRKPYKVICRYAACTGSILEGGIYVLPLLLFFSLLRIVSVRQQLKIFAVVTNSCWLFQKARLDIFTHVINP